MKILFISKFDLPDFQNDMIFHGLRSLYGVNVIPSNDPWYMYTDMHKKWNLIVPNNGMSYGRGFTLYGKLLKIPVDNSNIQKKVQDRWFDKIIYGSITRCDDYFVDVVKSYKSNDILCIDGEDNTDINHNYSKHSVYFKRELIHTPSENIRPIGFCIPSDLIVKNIPHKEQDYGTVIPGDSSTYIFNLEIDYFKDYQKSYFGLTHRKGGWDCLRHYEILMNGCIPYFPDISKCPQFTMTNFPKDIINITNEIIKNGQFNISRYNNICEELLHICSEKLTTVHMASTILS